jgi:hypothetical protein
MDLHDYVDPADPYTPRPKASQAVAAARRALGPAPDAPVVRGTPVRQYLPFGIGALVLIVLMIAAASWQLSRMPAKPLQLAPTDAPARALAAPPTTAPAPTSASTPAAATIGAYAAPDGLLLGQIEADRPITPVAHYGVGWIAYQDGAGLVWVRAVDRPDLALAGPDLAPRTAALPQTGQGFTLDQGGVHPPLAVESRATGQKEAPDRAARHAAAVARDQEAHGQKAP